MTSPSSARLCRQRHWAAGTRVVGTDGVEIQYATITAVGADLVLANVDGIGEIPLDLRYQPWREADDAGDAA